MRYGRDNYQTEKSELLNKQQACFCGRRVFVIFNYSSLDTENQLSNQWGDWYYFSRSQIIHQSILQIGSFFALF